MSKQAILYTRVSTDPQDKGYSPETQLQACRNYAERLGYAIVAELQDTHSGATPIAERPTGKELVAMLKRRDANAVIVYCVDRLSRDIVDLLATVRDWIRSGVEVHTCDIGRIKSELDIVLVIKGWQGSDEREKIRERTSRGRNGKAQSGKVVGSGKPRYGYRYVYQEMGSGKRTVIGLAIVDAEAHIVKLIFRWYAYGNAVNGYKPMPALGIARRLSEMQTLSPDKRNIARERGPHIWSQTAVLRILQDEVYAGVYRYGKLIGKNGRGGNRPTGEQITVSVPAIIDRDLWRAAQERRAYNKLMSQRNCKHEYLLRGMGTCGACQYSFLGDTRIVRGKRYFYYHCSQNSHRFPTLETICRQKAVRAEVLECAVWDYILKQWRDAKDFECKLRILQQDELDSLQPKRERLEAVLSLIADCEREALDTAHAMKRARGVVSQKLEREQEEINERHEALTMERDELLLALDSRRYTEKRIAAALRTREDVVTGLDATTFEDKRRILEFLRVQVTVRDGTAWVACVVAAEAVPIDLHTSTNTRRDR